MIGRRGVELEEKEVGQASDARKRREEVRPLVRICNAAGLILQL